MGKEVEVLYYPSSEHKEADLRLCFRICKTLVFSRGGSFTAIVITLIIHTGISNGEIYDRACVKMIIQKKGCLCLQKQTFKYLCLIVPFGQTQCILFSCSDHLVTKSVEKKRQFAYQSIYLRRHHLCIHTSTCFLGFRLTWQHKIKHFFSHDRIFFLRNTRPKANIMSFSLIA